MTSKIELSKNQFYGIWILIAVLVLALLLVLLEWPSPPAPPGNPQQPTGGGLILDRKRVPVSPELKAFLGKEGYPVIMLPQENGGIKIVNREGGEIPPCKSQKRETGVECPPFRKVDVEAIEQITILETDRCKDIRVNGNEVRVHAKGPRAGLAPCHRIGAHSAP
jgi:hypothetical protein